MSTKDLKSMSPREVLEAHAAGRLALEDAEKALRAGWMEDVGFARIDHDRAGRRGIPEVIYGRGKTPEQIAGIFARLAERNPNVLCTHASKAAAELVVAALPEAEFHGDCGVLRLWRDREPKGLGSVCVVAAGTSDLPVAREALLCAQIMGEDVELLVDVGVAGLHRLVAVVEQIRTARVVISVAGMEAALPSVLAGLIDRPLISVPTSVGYGAAFHGVAALLSSLTACSPGVLTVNIDNGFGAAYAAALMNRP